MRAGGSGRFSDTVEPRSHSSVSMQITKPASWVKTLPTRLGGSGPGTVTHGQAKNGCIVE